LLVDRYWISNEPNEEQTTKNEQRMKRKIVILPGDGIGKEVTTEGKKVLEKIAELFGHSFVFDEAIIGHDAIEATGNPLPDETLS
jgi:3-isopropylmalate dehydrogenase